LILSHLANAHTTLVRRAFTLRHIPFGGMPVLQYYQLVQNQDFTVITRKRLLIVSLSSRDLHPFDRRAR
jgi:hypothetical protein